MQIHTVKSGDTIFKIAREYSTSPMKIIENNELHNPDRLAVGQEILILNPTRTYNVRGADTLKRIADRFSVGYNSLLSKNPYLAGGDKIYPGQILTIKHDSPCYGMAAANGYYYKHTKKDRVIAMLPYLTYITVSVGKRVDGEIKLLFDDTEILNIAHENSKGALMRVYDTYEIFTDEYADSLALLAKTHGYNGITLAAYNAIKSNPDLFAEFLLKLKRRLMELDLLLFCELDGNRGDIIKDCCDGYIIMYDTLDGKSSDEEAYYKNFSNLLEASKGYTEIPSIAYMGNEIITKDDAENLAYTSRCEIKKDENEGFCYFDINKYRFGKRESIRVKYESLENIKAKLCRIGELGFMGIHFDIMNIPIEYIMLFEVMFTKATYPSGAI